ncbi:MAG: glycosyltransferase family 9 protein [Candidatus Aminicenantes bacterium]|nr:glycosyltransferase family 9 protein [Candidatus Aminicenantes bacterium]
MLRPNCRFWRGDKPCQFKRLCLDCPHFQAIDFQILIIKCRAQGDVLRTTCLIPALEKRYPGSVISWVVDPESVDLLPQSRLHRIWPFELESLLALEVQEFDLLISLDKEPGPAALATKLRSRKKFGFGLNEKGNLIIFNEASAYAWRLGVDDELKFHLNQKTYQEIIYEIAELPYERNEYVFYLEEPNKDKAKNFFTFHGLNDSHPRIGLNTGAGTKFETKQWPREYFLELIRLLQDKFKATIFLLGGQREREFNHALMKLSNRPIYNTGNDNSLLEFAGFISMMDIIVTSDTLGMHLAIALKKPVVALFGPTSPQEIDLYDRGQKLFAGLDCSPCYRQKCPDLKCLKAITPQRVAEAVGKLL